MKEVVIKAKETREGVRFRVLKDDKYIFLHVPFQNYFYVKKQDYLTNEKEFYNLFKFCIQDVKPVGQFSKIIFKSNWMRNKVRRYWDEKCHTFEADIMANKRFLLDKKIILNNTQIPYTFYDIETDDRLPLQKDERGLVMPGEARILSFAATDYKGKQVYFELNSDTDADEKALLTMIIRYFAEYGIISGWNSIRFDMPYIKGRCDALGINYDILEYINHLDYLDMFKKYDKKSRKSYSLNNISNEVLRESKIDQEKGGGAIYRTWESNKSQLKKYNMEDSNLVYKIDLQVEFVKLSMNMADLSICHVQNTMNNSDFGDFLLMREYKKANIIMPSKPTIEEVEQRKKEGKIGGGYTTCFRPGFHKDVHVWDFASEYPSVIQTWNISPETYVETIHNEEDAKAVDRNKFIVTPHDFENIYHPARVYKKEEGVVPRVVRNIVEERNKTKYSMEKYKNIDPDKYKRLFMHQYALKTIANSIYGILSFIMSRYYSWEVGDTVTTCARATLKACNNIVKDWGGDVIGGDTDSSFIKIVGEVSKEQIDRLFKSFLEDYANQFGCIVNKLEFEYEKTFDRMLFVKKKHYAYRIGEDITIKGMEAIKSDTNKKAAEMQKNFIFDVLKEEYNEEGWAAKIKELYNIIYNQNMTSADLLLIKALTKMPKDYQGEVIDSKTGKPKVKNDGTIQQKAIPAHVKLAERLISQGKDIYPGSKIKYIVIQNKPILAISVEEFEKGEGTFPYKHKKYGEMDYEWSGGYDALYYWLRILKPLIKVVYAYHNEIPDWEFNLTKSQFKKMLVEKEV